MTLLSGLRRLLQPATTQRQAHETYIALIAQARNAFFYRECGIPDTLEGRFEMAVLHMFLLLYRLKQEGGYTDFSRQLTEAYFADMDRSLREMGIGDTGISRRVKAMARAFYGRVQAYEETISNPNALKQALAKNAYCGATPYPEQLEQLAAYTLAAVNMLSKQDASALSTGSIFFPQP